MIGKLIAAAVGAVLIFSTHQALAQYPDKPVTLVVPFPAGGGTDVGARVLAKELSSIWKQTVLVDNRPGAAGAIGATFEAQSKPDGYTIMMGNIGTQAINPLILSKLSYDPRKDFTNISLVAELPLVLVTRPDLEANSIDDLIALAKKEPGKISFSTSGPGSSMHLAAELFASMTGTELYHVPYSGGAPAVQDVLGGHIDIAFATILESRAQIESKSLKALGVTGSEAVAALPDVRPIGDLGVKGYNSISWQGLVAPAGTPTEIVQKIASDVKQAMTKDEVRNLFVSQGAIPVGSTPEEFSALIDRETARYKSLIEQARIKVE